MKDVLFNMQKPKGVIYEKDTLTENYGKFKIGPFEKGFGTTIGNSLRRVLLSSIPGYAVTSVRIDGVLHEFQAIDGVVEDIPVFLLNLKEVRPVLQNGEEIKTIHIEKKGKGEFKAGDIENVDPEVKILNPGLHLLTTNDDADLSIDLTIEYGRGYRTAEEAMAKFKDAPEGTIPIDAKFSPVKRVNFEVSSVRVGSGMNYEQVILEIETDGGVTPEDALITAAKILIEYLSIFVEKEFEKEDIKNEVEEMERKEEEKKLIKLLSTPLEELELSVRSANCLSSEGVKILGDIVIKKEEDLIKIRNFGKKSLEEIKEKLSEYGLSLGMKELEPLVQKAREGKF